MSIDLEWSKLDSSLASHLVDVLNRQLANTTRPSFIGPVEVTSLDFGSIAPDIELVDLRDIYRDFLEDDDDLERDPVKVTEGAEDDDGFEWVSRRAARDDGLAYHHLPPHVRYGRSPTDMFASTPALHAPRATWKGSMSLPSLTDFKQQPHFRSPTPSTPFSLPLQPRPQSWVPYNPSTQAAPTDPSRTSSEPTPAGHGPPSDMGANPNLQLHLHINWHSNLRITLITSLLINYPSPMFMSLPIKLSVTGLLFNGELAVAYEGERRRVHICILDDLDPYGPAGVRPKRGSATSTPPELDDDPPSVPLRPSKPLPVGLRLLPSIYIESEIGQADKHVLKNVTRVERFIQDVIRRTVEDELVFPNFHTLLMGEP
jgi:distribution and morphology protein 12